MLTESELDAGRMVGETRQEVDKAKGFKDRHGFDGKGSLEKNISGARGELAVANYLRMDWPAEVNYRKGSADIGHNIQVRTATDEDYKLIFRKDDQWYHYFIFCLDKAPIFYVMGWMLGAWCMDPKWEKDPNDRPPAWFVPQQDLWDMESFWRLEHIWRHDQMQIVRDYVKKKREKNFNFNEQSNSNLGAY